VSALGSPRLHLRLTDSTNERARELAAAGAPHGTLVSADEQSAGRGRQGRRWSAPPGSALLMTLILRDPQRLLPLMAAVAACEAAGSGALIKWPNDIVLELPRGHGDPGAERRPAPLGKLAGILAEGRPQEGWVVLGIGMNVAVRLRDLPAELRDGGGPGLPAATLARASEDVEPMLESLLEALERWLAAPEEAVLAAWRARDALVGREISWGSGAGIAAGIDGEGRLVVALAGGGQTALGAGEVHLAPLAD
jgi:BirA family biotin operon repressor/biotin-[acetyl-CoA-carboxylase] ligase